MLNTLSLRARLVGLIAMQALLLIFIGAVGLSGLKRAADTTRVVDDGVNRLAINLEFRKNLRDNLLDTATRVSLGAIDWKRARQQLAGGAEQFEKTWNEFLAHYPSDQSEQISKEAQPDHIREAFATLQRLYLAEDANALKQFISTGLDPLFKPAIETLTKLSDKEKDASLKALKAAAAADALFLNTIGFAFLLGLAVVLLQAIAVSRSITRPLQRITTTVDQVTSGNFSARTGISGNDEIGRLGSAFDKLLEDRLTTLAMAELESESLNDSVISLLQSVSKIAGKDLTVRATVTDDIAGPLADAINHLAGETGAVMAAVQKIANQVEIASGQVNNQAHEVSQVAKQQEGEVLEASAKLAAASEGMSRIAALAEQCNRIAQHTTESTHTASESVQGTMTNIQDIRETIQETGKRIKRLGERSQEISGIVDIINRIAERTTVLALNASMQAAAAGEAGRGFAVVADEVQRLAESSRSATAQISTLVKNIQVETGDTMATMDRVIDQVVKGSQLAETAGKQMQASTKTTSDLVRGVGNIAASSNEQARASDELIRFAASLREQAMTTSQRIEEQLGHTNSLVEYARDLVKSVKTFKISA